MKTILFALMMITSTSCGKASGFGGGACGYGVIGSHDKVFCASVSTSQFPYLHQNLEGCSMNGDGNFRIEYAVNYYYFCY